MKRPTTDALRRSLAGLLTLIIACGVGGAALAQTSGPLQLPNGEHFDRWQDSTEYEKVYHVDQRHAAASDGNPGTRDRPFRTINRAARAVAPGEKVLVHGGVYRERITPQNGGESPRQMIFFQAAPGERVVVKGSRVFDPEWERSVDSHGEEYSQKLWQAPIPERWFQSRPNLFQTPNATDRQLEIMHWATRWQGRVPYTLPRGLIFQDGRRLTQLANYEDLVHLPGSYWVDQEENEVHVHPFGSYQPDTSTFEGTVQQHLFAPEKRGLAYIRVEGFTFEQAGNGFPRIGTGAVYVNGGHHWIIEDNSVRQVNSVGIEAGARFKEHAVATEAEDRQMTNNPGGFIIRGNTVSQAGTGGIQGHTVHNSLITQNYIHHIGWQDVEQYWETAAIKLLRNNNTIISRNHIHAVESAPGIWLDWDNKNSRATGNVLHDIAPNNNGAIFLEASRTPNLIDHNVIWNADTDALSVGDTDNARVMHNLVGHSRVPIVVQVITDRTLDDRPMTAKNQIIKNNLFYENEQPPVIEDEENTLDHNIFVDPADESGLRQWLDRWGEHNSIAPATISEVLAGTADGWQVRRASFAPWNYEVVAAYPEADVKAALWPVRRGTGLGGVFVAALLTGLLFALLRRTVLVPVMRVAAASRRFAEGAADVEVDVRSGDEVGQLAGSFNDMVGNIRKRTQSLSALVQITRTINQERDLEGGLEALLENTQAITSAKYAALSVFGEDGQIESFLTRGMSEAEQQAIGRLPEGQGLLGHIHEQAESLRLADMSEHPASVGFPEGHPPMKSLLAVPIRLGDRPLGNLYLSDRTDGRGRRAAGRAGGHLDRLLPHRAGERRGAPVPRRARRPHAGADGPLRRG